MLGRPEITRTAAIILLIVVLIAALTAINRRPSTPVVADSPTIITSAPDDLSAELRRCSALGPKDAVDAHCVAVWEENRRRFFGRPVRPLPPTSPGAAAPATNTAGEAR